MFRADWRTLGFVLTKLGLQSNPEIVNRKDPDGATCLMFAAMRGQLAIAEFLIDHAAAVDAQDSISGWTALMQVHAAPPLRSDFAPLAEGETETGDPAEPSAECGGLENFLP